MCNGFMLFCALNAVKGMVINMIKICFIVLICLTFSFPSYALDYSFWEYGTMIGNPVTLDGGVMGRNYWFTNTGNYKTPYVTDEYAHGGKYSLALDCTTSTGSIKIEMQRVYPQNDMQKNNKVYCEAYLKGFNEKPSNMYVVAMLYDALGNAKKEYKLNFEPADANGWHKCWCLIPSGIDYDSVRFYVLYNYYEGMDVLYIDDMSVWYVPDSLDIKKNSETYETVLDLYSLNLKGADCIGNKRPIYATDNVDYSVANGDAYVKDNRYLVYTGSGDGAVTCTANLFGVSTDFNVNFKQQVTIGEISETNGEYFVTLANNTDVKKHVEFAVCLFDGSSLSAVKRVNETLGTRESKDIKIKGFEIPFYVNNPIIKTYIITR